MLGREDLTTGAFGGQAIDVSSGVESLRVRSSTFATSCGFPVGPFVGVES